MICPRCDIHHDGPRTRREPMKPQWCEECLEELQEGMVARDRSICSDILTGLGLSAHDDLDLRGDEACFVGLTIELIQRSFETEHHVRS
jgi:hypothetical protein